MNKEIENFISNPLNVMHVIQEINNQFPVIVEQYLPTNPHRDAINYFISGSCPTYAELLHELFKGYASYYNSDKEAHVLVKIGPCFYDVSGLNLDPNEPSLGYKKVDDDMFEYITQHYGRNDGEEKIIYQHLLEIGKDILKEKLKEDKEKTR